MVGAKADQEAGMANDTEIVAMVGVAEVVATEAATAEAVIRCSRQDGRQRHRASRRCVDCR